MTAMEEDDFEPTKISTTDDGDSLVGNDPTPTQESVAPIRYLQLMSARDYLEALRSSPLTHSVNAHVHGGGASREMDEGTACEHTAGAACEHVRDTTHVHVDGRTIHSHVGLATRDNVHECANRDVAAQSAIMRGLASHERPSPHERKRSRRPWPRERPWPDDPTQSDSPMASKNVIADLTKGDKLDGTNYDIWHQKIQYLLNEQELLDHITTSMTPPAEGNTAQHQQDQETYNSWFNKDHSTHIILLSSMQDDLIGDFEKCKTAKDMWDNLKIAFGGTSTMRLRALVLKFETLRKDPRQNMTSISR
ncbi:hypothetical protein ZIOFF_008306 [Zingiber officinale]|uniref:Uncharacterized protein n=1 Tax=Zingiber officinale TaxID=94328 RepID=A0A8J5IFC1_ZINOF|nr:hypothetical protein ZIOFF_008306 [Zingiber officinale]